MAKRCSTHYKTISDQSTRIDKNERACRIRRRLYQFPIRKKHQVNILANLHRIFKVDSSQNSIGIFKPFLSNKEPKSITLRERQILTRAVRGFYFLLSPDKNRKPAWRRQKHAALVNPSNCAFYSKRR